MKLDEYREKMVTEKKAPQDAFQEAIDKGYLGTNPSTYFFAGNYMYMYTLDGVDYFKHKDTRKYIHVT